MKLLFCKQCQDVVLMAAEERLCLCGKSGGVYWKNEKTVDLWGDAIALGFQKAGLLNALQNQPETGWGSTFEAFVIPKKNLAVRTYKDYREYRAKRGERCATQL